MLTTITVLLKFVSDYNTFTQLRCVKIAEQKYLENKFEILISLRAE